MAWQRLDLLPLPPWYPASLKKQAEALNEQIGALLANRASLDSTVAGIKAQDPATVDLVNTVGFPALGETQAELLKTELEVRRRIQAFYASHHHEAEKAAAKAAKHLSETEAKVLKGLEDMGYPLEGPDRPPWIPGMVRAHPEVRAARQRAEGLRSASQERDTRNDNERSMAIITQELQQAIATGLPA